MKVDYIAIMQEYYGNSANGFLTDSPKPVKLSQDAVVEMRFDSQTYQWIPNRQSKIVYPKARELVKQYRREYNNALLERGCRK